MRPLPALPYTFREWKKLKVNRDYHVQVSGTYYSIPYAYAHRRLDVSLSENMVECFLKGKRIALHERLYEKGASSTNPKHMPNEPRRYQERLYWLDRARAVRPHAETLTRAILNRREHPELGYRSIMGILSLKDNYTKERLDAACRLVLLLGWRAQNYRSVSSILRTGRDQVQEAEAGTQAVLHENIRGGTYYDSPQ